MPVATPHPSPPPEGGREVCSNVTIRVPARPQRDQRLDIVRGWLQLTIFASHAFGSFIGGWMIHGSWGLSDSSEQFVFLSGFTLGSVCARKAAAGGWRAGTADILWRAWRLYRIHLLVFVLYGAMVVAAGATFLPGEAARLNFDFALNDPVHALPGVLTMLYQPQLMGILPIFVWCMLLLPGFIALVSAWGAWALVPPVLVYAAVWVFGLHAPSLAPDLGIAFNPFAWQLLFLTGAWLGRRALLNGRALPWDAPWAGWVTAAAVLMVLVGLALRLSWYGFLPWHLPVAEDEILDRQGGFGAAAAAACVGAGLAGGAIRAAGWRVDARAVAERHGADRALQPGGVLRRAVSVVGRDDGAAFVSGDAAARSVADRRGVGGARLVRAMAGPAAVGAEGRGGGVVPEHEAEGATSPAWLDQAAKGEPP